MGDPELGAERQRAVGAGHGVLVETLTRGGLGAGFVAVKGGYSGKAVAGTGRRGDRRIGVAPGILGRTLRIVVGRLAGVMEVPMAVVMPFGLGRGFSDTPTEEESCGENSKRRTRLGYSSQYRVFRCQHSLVP
jgi:hypothetical protein